MIFYNLFMHSRLNLRLDLETCPAIPASNLAGDAAVIAQLPPLLELLSRIVPLGSPVSIPIASENCDFINYFRNVVNQHRALMLVFYSFFSSAAYAAPLTDVSKGVQCILKSPSRDAGRAPSTVTFCAGEPHGYSTGQQREVARLNMIPILNTSLE